MLRLHFIASFVCLSTANLIYCEYKICSYSARLALYLFGVTFTKVCFLWSTLTRQGTGRVRLLIQPLVCKCNIQNYGNKVLLLIVNLKVQLRGTKPVPFVRSSLRTSAGPFLFYMDTRWLIYTNWTHKPVPSQMLENWVTKFWNFSLVFSLERWELTPAILAPPPPPPSLDWTRFESLSTSFEIEKTAKKDVRR